MNVNLLIKRYFSFPGEHPKIEMFDDANIYNVYRDIIEGLLQQSDINLSVLQALGYCLYEVLDNVLIHSGKKCGIVIHSYDEGNKAIKLMIVDDGIGIKASLQQNPIYKDVSEQEALRICIQNSVSDGKGMGFGLYSMSRLVESAGLDMQVHSGEAVLRYHDKQFKVEKVELWQGTQVYLELHSDIDIDANSVVENHTDLVNDFNESFIEDDDNRLW